MGLVLISHSGPVAEGLRDMVKQVAGNEVAVGIAGGTEDGRLGTSAPRITAALRTALDAGADGVLVLFDLGSAALSLELALEDLDPSDRDRVRVSEAPLVEGSIDGAAASVREAGRAATLVQNGYLRSYVLALTAGLAVLAVLFVALR